MDELQKFQEWSGEFNALIRDIDAYLAAKPMNQAARKLRERIAAMFGGLGGDRTKSTKGRVQ